MNDFSAIFAAQTYAPAQTENSAPKSGKSGDVPDFSRVFKDASARQSEHTSRDRRNNTKTSEELVAYASATQSINSAQVAEKSPENNDVQPVSETTPTTQTQQTEAADTIDTTDTTDAIDTTDTTDAADTTEVSVQTDVTPSVQPAVDTSGVADTVLSMVDVQPEAQQTQDIVTEFLTEMVSEMDEQLGAIVETAVGDAAPSSEVPVEVNPAQDTVQEPAVTEETDSEINASNTDAAPVTDDAVDTVTATPETDVEVPVEEIPEEPGEPSGLEHVEEDLQAPVEENDTITDTPVVETSPDATIQTPAEETSTTNNAPSVDRPAEITTDNTVGQAGTTVEETAQTDNTQAAEAPKDTTNETVDESVETPNTADKPERNWHDRINTGRKSRRAEHDMALQRMRERIAALESELESIRVKQEAPVETPVVETPAEQEPEITAEAPVEEIQPSAPKTETSQDSSYVPVNNYTISNSNVSEPEVVQELFRVTVQDVVDQLVDAFRSTTLADGTSMLEIQLRPAQLGKISILVSSTSDGLSAQIKVPNDRVNNLLSVGLSDLVNTLKQMGINVRQMDITQSELNWDFARGNMGDQASGQNQGQNNQNGSSNGYKHFEGVSHVAGQLRTSATLYGNLAMYPLLDEDNSVEFRA